VTSCYFGDGAFLGNEPSCGLETGPPALRVNKRGTSKSSKVHREEGNTVGTSGKGGATKECRKIKGGGRNEFPVTHCDLAHGACRAGDQDGGGGESEEESVTEPRKMAFFAAVQFVRKGGLCR